MFEEAEPRWKKSRRLKEIREYGTTECKLSRKGLEGNHLSTQFLMEAQTRK
jgi:hypothetical protein